MGNIVLLDDLTINKIAAGEVIERPASVVKEVVENSIDAGSDNISIEIRNGGISYIRITDNGKGIAADDLEIAFERHATSKIRRAEDLETVKSMGFRGEALASIAAIARVELVTKIEDSDIGHRIVVEGGKVLLKEETGCPKGTSITVENLFYNTPVRYKFLKKDFTESGYIEDAIARIALVNPNIAIKFVNSGKTVIQTSGNGEVKDIIYGIYGKDVAENVISVNYNFEDMVVSGVIGKPNIARSNRSNQLFFVNKRYVKDKTLTSAAEKAFKDVLAFGKYGFLVLNIEIDSHKLDVNVHPAKLEVRFQDENKIFKLIYHAIKEALVKENIIQQDIKLSESDYIDEIERIENRLFDNTKTTNTSSGIKGIGGFFKSILGGSKNEVPTNNNLVEQVYKDKIKQESQDVLVDKSNDFMLPNCNGDNKNNDTAGLKNNTNSDDNSRVNTKINNGFDNNANNTTSNEINSDFNSSTNNVSNDKMDNNFNNNTVNIKMDNKSNNNYSNTVSNGTNNNDTTNNINNGTNTNINNNFGISASSKSYNDFGNNNNTACDATNNNLNNISQSTTNNTKNGITNEEFKPSTNLERLVKELDANLEKLNLKPKVSVMDSLNNSNNENVQNSGLNSDNMSEVKVSEEAKSKDINIYRNNESNTSKSMPIDILEVDKKNVSETILSDALENMNQSKEQYNQLHKDGTASIDNNKTIKSEDTIQSVTNDGIHNVEDNENTKEKDSDVNFEEMYAKMFGTKISNRNKVAENTEENGYTAKQEDFRTVESVSLFTNNILYNKPIYKYIGIVFEENIVIEYEKEMYIVDQRAANERILYERIRQNYYNEAEKDSQLMLLPDLITVSDREMGIVEDNIELFKRAGFDLEIFGDKTVKLSAVPSMCLELDTKKLFLFALNEINTVARTAKQEIEEKFFTAIACKVAVKAKLAFTKNEVDNLIQQLLALPHPFVSPKGTPTAIRMSKADIERKFSRR